MPFTDTPDQIIAAITNMGRVNLARATFGEISFKVFGFAVGNSGYQDSNPVKVMPIDPSMTSLANQVFPVSGQQPYSAFEFPTPSTIVTNCRLGSNDAVSALGEIGLWCQIIYSTVSPAEVGTNFLFAVGHFPLITKTLNQTVVYRFITQF